MIENLKNRPKTINEKNLAFVNSWWDKDLIKNTKTVKKYLTRFNKTNLFLNIANFQKDAINYREFLDFTNKGFTFLLQKEKQISSEVKVVQKLQKMIHAFGEQAGILANIQTIDEYFTTINKEDIGNKKVLATNLGNNVILKFYEAYKKMNLKVLGKDDLIKEKLLTLFATDKVSETSLFDVSINVKVLFKFASLAFRTKKINQEEFAVIYFNTIFISAYLSKFSNLYHYFSMQIK